MSKIVPAPFVEIDLDGSARWLNRMDKAAEFLCTIEWSWSPAHGRIEAYYLHRGRTHWILWVKGPDAWGRREKPIATARCLRKAFLLKKDAAMNLLVAAFREERRWGDLDSFHCVTKEGLLSIGDLDSVSYAVWGKRLLDAE
jgi:hypothetical protein